MTTTAAMRLPADWRDFFALTKPRVMSLVVFTGLCGLLAAPGHIHPVLGFTAVLCIAMGALRESGMRDGLTGVRNRAWLAANALRPAIAQAAVVIIDVDHFKSVNDRHGHAAGDAWRCASSPHRYRLPTTGSAHPRRPPPSRCTTPQ